MQKNFLLFLLVFSLIPFSIHAQKRYDKWWDQVEAYEIEGQSKSALKRTDFIYQKAKKQDNQTQLVKAFLYISKYSLILKEDAYAEVIADFEKEIALQKAPTQQILSSILAESLQEYLRNNEYSINQLKSSPNPSQFKTWTKDFFLEKIEKYYRISLQNKSELLKIQDKEWNSLLTYGRNYQEYQTTLYDLMARRYLDFLKTQTTSIAPKSFQEFYGSYINDSIYFGLSDEFVKLDIPAVQQEKALRFYQELEQGNDLSALIYQLERLEMLLQKAWLKDKNQVYLNRLHQLKAKHSDPTQQAFIRYYLAKFYFQNANKEENADYYSKALDEINAILKSQANAEISSIAKGIFDNIKAKKLELRTENNFRANRVNKALVNYKNVDTLYLSVYKNFPFNEFENQPGADSLLRDFAQSNKPNSQEVFALTNPKPHFEFSTEILLPALESGNHLLVFSSNKRMNGENAELGFHMLKATKITYFSKLEGSKLQIFVVDNETGTPIAQAKIQIFSADQKQVEQYDLVTDESGMAEFMPKNSKFNSFYGEITYKNDSLVLKRFQLSLNDEMDDEYDDDDEIELSLTTKILTDRGIYRPGQDLYFKAFLALEENGIPKAGKDMDATIYLMNPKHAIVDSLAFKTNEFGTFSGQFKLPKSGLYGQYYLEIDSDYEDGEADNEWRYFDSEEVYFRVEEYKRPSFSVDFDKIHTHYELGDSVKIKGNAKAFFGGNIAQAKVRYTVKQRANRSRFAGLTGYFSMPEFEIISGTTETDSEGHFEIVFDTEAFHLEKMNWTYSISAEVIDANGETQSNVHYITAGNPGLVANMLGKSEIELGNQERLELVIQDHNQVDVDQKGTLKIYRLEKMDRAFRNRSWNIPEIQNIDYEEFIRLFPYEQYAKSEKKENRKRHLVKEISTSKSNEIFRLDEFPKLTAGEYFVEWVADEDEDLRTEKYFHILDAEAQHGNPKEFLKLTYDIKKSDEQQLLRLTFDAMEELYVYMDLSADEVSFEQKSFHLNKGENKLAIAWPENTKQIDLVYAYNYQAVFENRQVKIKQDAPDEDLIFEVKTFKNKMLPGAPETWELKVMNPDKSPADAEVLASMYDSSLDEFAHFEWDPRFDLEGDNFYTYPNSFNSTQGGLNYGFRNIYYHFTSPILNLTKTDLKDFGCSLDYPVDYNRRFVNEIRRKKVTKTKNVITGVVMDDDGLPIPAVNVQVIGQDYGTATDFDGNFEINAKKGSQLQFSTVGFEDKVVRVENNKADLTVYLMMMAHLDEVVVTGYAAANEEILQGRVAGLTGGSGSTSEVRIRGANSISAGSSPLYIVDGVPTSAQEVMNLREENILEVSVLAPETAISLYGSEAEDGVVLIMTKEGLEELEQIQTRENLQETAFFIPDLRTDESGHVRFTFDSPEALTKWKFQAFAHNRNLQKTYLKLETVTQKDLNLIPNFPRFFRAGDQVKISAKITNLSDEKLNGTAQLKLIDELTGQEVNLLKTKRVVNFKTDSKASAQVEWMLEIPENLMAVRYEISAKAGRFTDGETAIIPVLTNREFVTETLAFWLNPQEEKDFVLENLSDNSSESLTHQNLVLDYTTNPAWMSLQVLPMIAKTTFRGSEQIFAKYYVHGLAEKILKENPKIEKLLQKWSKNDINQNAEMLQEFEETPWLASMISLEEQQKELADLLSDNPQRIQEHLNDLKNLQLASGGFPWFEGGVENQAISLHILSGLGKVGKPENEDLKSQYEQITGRLIDYLDKTFLSEKSKANLFSTSANLDYLYARSFYQIDDSIQAIHNKKYKKLQENWLDLNLRNKIVLGIVAQRNGQQALAKKIVKSLIENAVINSTTGMYWKENKSSWFWYEAPIETQALAIELFAEADESKEQINALKTWLLRQKHLQAWRTTRATTDAVYAVLIQGTDLVSAENSARIEIGKQTYQVDTKSNPAGHFEVKFNADEIDQEKSRIHIKNQSDSPQYGGMYWQYFEDADQIEAFNLPELKIEKRLLVEKYSGEGKQLVPVEETTIEIGDKIKVRLIITAQEDFEFMELKDMRASGLEPIDVLSGYKYQNGLRYYQVTKDMTTYFFFDRIKKGHYELEYELRANNSGDFSAGNAELKSLYAPEFTSKTKGERIRVK